MATTKQAMQHSTIRHHLRDIQLFRQQREEARKREEERQEAERLAMIVLKQEKSEEAIRLVEEACVNHLCQEFVGHEPEHFDRLGVGFTLCRHTGKIDDEEIPGIKELRDFIVSEKLDEYGVACGEFLLGSIWEELTARLERTVKFIFSGCEINFIWGYTQAHVHISVPMTSTPLAKD